MRLDISYDIQDFLTDYHRWLFPVMLRFIEDLLPVIKDYRARTGRKAYPAMPFIRAFLSKISFQTGNK